MASVRGEEALAVARCPLDEPWARDPRAGARGAQLAELALKSSAEGRRPDVPELMP
ncbi:hypothetical protein ACIP98_22285 [Streptomyces sp. NPDC088354]|uniref:hypothetical protein n=1 Tax=unclassified Streptomyces TaxID=2593676 RepID=UPI0029AB3AE9|nr:hypothetical protein [Streptomyces sp. MI02-7b]MDX3074678.1 hypothetical protein [Streptomyces sp. MI02-7b]